MRHANRAVHRRTAGGRPRALLQWSGDAASRRRRGDTHDVYPGPSGTLLECRPRRPDGRRCPAGAVRWAARAADVHG